MAIIELDSIGKSYADGDQTHRVLSGLSLSVDAGEFVAILGPSGSGKSTLLSITGLLLSADEGNISIAGQDLTKLSQRQWTRKRLELLGFIFQDHQLLPYMRIGDQLELVAKLKGQKDRHKRHAEVRSLMADLGIEDSYRKYPRQMSGGQKQRAAIARAFIGNPQLILADEPTAALDVVSARVVLDWFAQIAAEGACVLMVTHDPAAAARAQRVVVMDGGHVVEMVPGGNAAAVSQALLRARDAGAGEGRAA